MNEQTVDYNQDENSVDIRQYLALFWQWAWLILLAALLAGGIAFLINKRTTPVYEATTKVMVNQAPSTQTTDYTSILTSQQLTGTYTQMITTTPILDEVAQQLNFTGDMAEFKKSISVSPVPSTQILVIKVRSTDPVFAANAANTLVTVFANKVTSIQAERFTVSKQNLQKQISDMDNRIKDLDAQILSTTDPVEKDRLETNNTQNRQIYSNLVMTYEQVRLSESQTLSNIVPVEPAETPILPVSPKVLQNTLLAALVGMFLAVGTIFAIDALDDTIRTPEEVTKSLGLPILAVISHFTSEEGKPIVESQPRSPVSEAFRTLRTNLQYTGVDSPLRAILVTSTEPSEGKTTVTVNLAAVFAQGGLRVTLIDADMRHPSIHKRLGNPNRFGLSSLFVRQEENLDGSLQSTRLPNLSIITAGDIPPNPSELLASQKMGLILGRIKETSDMVLLDTPPIMAVTDASVLVPIVDGVLIVVQPGVTRSTALRQTVEQLRRLNANILGIVFNNLDLRRSRYAYRYYYYRGYYNNKYHKYYAPEPNEHPRKKTVKTTAQETEEV